jgi:hypothetical protein
MRRLFILLAGALIASMLAALTVGSATAKKGHTQHYAAIAVSPSTVSQWFGYGNNKYRAKQNAYVHCQRSAQQFNGYTGDCQGAVWVRNGWVAAAYEKTKEEPYKKLSWGSGWGPNKGDAMYQARRTCRHYAQENCVVQDVRKSPQSNGQSTIGGGW